MDVNTFEEIVYDKDEETGIVTVTINSPGMKNALTWGVLLELYWAVDAMQKDDTAGAMILTGAKPAGTDDPTKEAFSSGGNLMPSYLESLDEEKKKQID